MGTIKEDVSQSVKASSYFDFYQKLISSHQEIAMTSFTLLLTIAAMATYVVAYPQREEAMLSALEVLASQLANCKMLQTIPQLPHFFYRVPKPCKAFLLALYLLSKLVPMNFATATVRIIPYWLLLFHSFIVIVMNQRCLQMGNIPPVCSHGGLFCYTVQWTISTGERYVFEYCPVGKQEDKCIEIL